jgi:hypothetical protein
MVLRNSHIQSYTRATHYSAYRATAIARIHMGWNSRWVDSSTCALHGMGVLLLFSFFLFLVELFLVVVYHFVSIYIFLLLLFFFRSGCCHVSFLFLSPFCFWKFGPCPSGLFNKSWGWWRVGVCSPPFGPSCAHKKSPPFSVLLRIKARYTILYVTSAIPSFILHPLALNVSLSAYSFTSFFFLSRPLLLQKICWKYFKKECLAYYTIHRRDNMWTNM